MIKKLDYNEDFDSFIDLSKKMLGEKNNSDLDMHRWLINDNKINASGEIFVYCEDGKVIGAYALSPVNLKARNLTLKAAYTMKLMTDEEYFRRGIFRGLNQVALEHAIENEIDALLVIANDESRAAYLRLGWSEILERRNYIKSLDMYNFYKKTNDEEESRKLNEQFKKDNDIEIKPMDSYESEVSSKLPEDYEVLFEKINKYEAMILRDREYMTFRYEKRPDRKYRFLVLRRDGEIKAIAVFRKSLAGQYNFCLVTEFLYVSDEDSKYLARALTNWAIEKEMLYIMMSKPEFSMDAESLEENGFKMNQNKPKNRFLMGFCPGGKIDFNDDTLKDNFELSFGDADLELDMP